MAKTAQKTAAKKTTGAPKTDISFGSWVKTVARARGDIAPFVLQMRDDKKITDKTPLKSAEAKYGSNAGFPKLADRYNAYLKRGPQSKAA